MGNYKMILQYEGTRYQGWQRQDSTDNTIQGKLEAILTKMQGTFVKVDGSGRTDAGVHAKGQVASFQLETSKSEDEIMEYLNRYLPEDIAVIDLRKVPARFHARLNAQGKTYEYRVLNTEIPQVFERRYAYVFSQKLDIEAMEKAAQVMCGTHDFQAFTSKKMKKSTIRNVEKISIKRSDEIKDELIFTFSGDGFLYHMVRIMMGTLLEVGTHKKNAEDIEEIIASRKREKAGFLVPGNGLTLLEVRYPKKCLEW